MTALHRAEPPRPPPSIPMRSESTLASSISELNSAAYAAAASGLPQALPLACEPATAIPASTSVLMKMLFPWSSRVSEVDMAYSPSRT